MKISNLEDVAKKWHHYLPIQSVGQLLSVAACYAVALIVALVAVKIIGDRDWPVYLYLGIAAGLLPSLIAALPQEFRIEANSPAAAQAILAKIDDLLVFRGYERAGPASGSRVRYVSRLPEILRWKENQFVIDSLEDRLVIRGPKGSIAWLRNRLA